MVTSDSPGPLRFVTGTKNACPYSVKEHSVSTVVAHNRYQREALQLLLWSRYRHAAASFYHGGKNDWSRCKLLRSTKGTKIYVLVLQPIPYLLRSIDRHKSRTPPLLTRCRRYPTLYMSGPAHCHPMCVYLEQNTA